MSKTYYLPKIIYKVPEILDAHQIVSYFLTFTKLSVQIESIVLLYNELPVS